jgi:hypothetical protein
MRKEMHLSSIAIKHKIRKNKELILLQNILLSVYMHLASMCSKTFVIANTAYIVLEVKTICGF